MNEKELSAIETLIFAMNATDIGLRDSEMYELSMRVLERAKEKAKKERLETMVEAVEEKANTLLTGRRALVEHTKRQNNDES